MNGLEREILAILGAAADMTIATVRLDGYPKATTVSFVNAGTTIYFGTGRSSPKAKSLARCDKVSATVNLPYQRWEEIRGLSLGGRATQVTEPLRCKTVGALMTKKFPRALDYGDAELEEMTIFQIEPEVVSLLDYRKGFGHADLVTFEPIGEVTP